MYEPTVMVVDDEKSVLDTLSEQLKRFAQGRFIVETAQSGEEALEVFDELARDGVPLPVIVSDHIMPGMKGTELLREIHQRSNHTLKILLTGQADADSVGSAVNEAGLYRYIAKPWAEDDLCMTVEQALRSFEQARVIAEKNAELARVNVALSDALAQVSALKDRLQAEVVYLREEIVHEHGFDDIIGTSAALATTLSLLAQVAPTDSTVLITGESGTGKELLARAVHERSRRSGRPLVKLNCAALPESLIESELFGHERGAFSGAVARRTGRFELADGGTLFLDEIGELPLALQSKLLRVIQEGEFERLGSSETRRVDVRIIAATNRDLASESAAGRFREDLYYRLNVFPIESPPLRSRSGDVALLAAYFARQCANRSGKRIDTIDARCLKQLERYRWPGNVRELQNVIERAVILCNGRTLTIGNPAPGSARTVSTTATDRPLQTLRVVEEAAIRAALTHCAGVVGGKSGAARLLDVPASTLRDRIQRYGIEP